MTTYTYWPCARQCCKQCWGALLRLLLRPLTCSHFSPDHCIFCFYKWYRVIAAAMTTCRKWLLERHQGTRAVAFAAGPLLSLLTYRLTRYTKCTQGDKF